MDRDNPISGDELHRVEMPSPHSEVLDLMSDLWGALLIVLGFCAGGLLAWFLYTAWPVMAGAITQGWMK